MLGIQAFDLFSGVYAILFAHFMLLCFSNIFMVLGNYCTVYGKLTLGYNQPANQYILVEYGNDIVDIASAIFQNFTYHLPFLKNTKRQLCHGKTKIYQKMWLTTTHGAP